MKKTYHGSCHCGGVQISAQLDLGDQTYRCNCSYCSKTRYWKIFTGPDDVTVLSGQELLVDYRGPHSMWPPGHIHHRFCTRCGVQLFSRGFLDQMGGWFNAVNLAVIDDASDEALAAAKVIFENGRDDKQQEPPSITAHM